MRPTTFICALAATLQLLSGTALADGWTWPIRGPVITSYRNGDDPYAAGQHRGIDIGAPVGTHVVAATAGTVTFSGVVGSAGLVVSERTADGRFDLSYLHLSSLSVHRGEVVGAGTTIGAVGISGRPSADAPHLHFGVREAGRRSAYRDPLDFLGAPPATERPGPVPAPVPARNPVVADPAPAAGQPAPASAHEPSPSAWPAPSHGPLPAPSADTAHAPAPHVPGVPVGMPSLLPSHQPAGEAAPHGAIDPGANHRALPRIRASDAPAGATTEAADRPGSTSTRPSAGPLVAARGPSGSSAAASLHDGRRAKPRRHHGINVGWLAACLGMIAAATALGHPDGTRRAAARGRTLPARARSAVRPGRLKPASGAATRRTAASTGALQRHPARQ